MMRNGLAQHSQRGYILVRTAQVAYLSQCDKPKRDKPKRDKPKRDKPKRDKPRHDELRGDELRHDELKGDKPRCNRCGKNVRCRLCDD